jgi:hypothetical protein
MRRLAGGRLEGVAEIGLGEPRQFCQFAKADCPETIRFNVVSDQSQLLTREAGPPTLGVTTDVEEQCKQCIDQSRAIEIVQCRGIGALFGYRCSQPSHFRITKLRARTGQPGAVERLAETPCHRGLGEVKV